MYDILYVILSGLVSVGLIVGFIYLKNKGYIKSEKDIAQAQRWLIVAKILVNKSISGDTELKGKVNLVIDIVISSVTYIVHQAEITDREDQKQAALEYAVEQLRAIGINPDIDDELLLQILIDGLLSEYAK